MGLFDRFRPDHRAQDDGVRDEAVNVPLAAPAQQPIDSFQAPARPIADPRNVVAPLTRERVRRVCDDQQWKYEVDEDGDVAGSWNGEPFYFIIAGDHDEILQVSSRLTRPIEEFEVDTARQFVDDWHRDKIWPKLALGQDSEGTIRLHATFAVDYEYGVADSQILQQLLCAIGTVGNAYDALKDTLETA